MITMLHTLSWLLISIATLSFARAKSNDALPSTTSNPIFVNQVNAALHKPSFVTRGGSTIAKKLKDPSIALDTAIETAADSVDTSAAVNASAVGLEEGEDYRNVFVTKRDGRLERLDKDKV